MGALCLLLALVGLAAVGGATASNQLTYNGRFTGKCGADGLYYKDHASFVICSNGEATDQNCAPGSANNDYEFYRFGRNYHLRHFCTVNLVPFKGTHYGGYPAAHGYGYGYYPYGYGYYPYGGYYPFGYGFYPYGAHPYGGFPYYGYGQAGKAQESEGDDQ